MPDHKPKSVNHPKPSDKTKGPGARIMPFLLPVLIIAAAGLLAFVLIKSRKNPQRIEAEPLAPLVEVRTLAARDIRMLVRGFGTVTPKVKVEIVPQVAGNIVDVHPQFKPGGFIPAGETIIRIEPQDYELAVQQAQAVVADAVVKLDLEKAEAQVARKEWDQLNPNTEPPSPLVLREPQIRQAQAMLESARAQLAKARLNLDRTKVSLPIDVVVLSEMVDLGQFAAVGQSVGSAYGIELVEIEVPLEDKELAWFDIPENPGDLSNKESSDKKTVALVNADFAGARHTWTGYVRRTVGQVDRTSRLIPVVVEVPDPFANSDSRPALMPGMFVEVVITGKVLKNAFAVPRTAIHNINQVWVIENDRLSIKSLHIVRTDQDVAYATSGLDDGDQVVLSALDAVTDGMQVRTQPTTQKPPKSHDANSSRQMPQGNN